jgi:hypothetical protein
VRLVIEGTIVIIVPFIALFPLDAISFLAPVFNSVACVFAVNDVV